MIRKLFLTILALLLCMPAALAGEILAEWNADFDGDGALEQFIIEGEDKGAYVLGSLVYRDGGADTVAMAGAGFALDQCDAWEMEDAALMKVEESYGIGGTTTHVFYLQDGEIVRANGLFRGLTRVQGNEFYYWQQDSDLNSDRSGGTLKPYYVHWTDGYFFEMGGNFISDEEVRAWPEGERALDWIYDNGFMVKTLLYRQNGIVNISYSDNIVNGNVTLQLMDGELVILDQKMRPTDMPEESNYGGTFQTMTGNSRYVTFPEGEFPQPAE